MTLSFHPGCFGSALAAQSASETCQRCSYQDECFARSKANQMFVLAGVMRKLKARGEGGIDRITRFLADRFEVVRTKVTTSNARSDKLLGRFEAEGVDLTALKRGRNPFSLESNPLHYHMAAFVLQGFPFKPKDMTEFVQTKWDSGLKTSSLVSEVARFSSALVAAGLLERKEKYILCLVV